MKSLSKRVQYLRPQDVTWPFSASDPYFLVNPAGTYHTQIHIHPFPCYVHERPVLLDEQARVEASFPIGFPPTYYVLPHDTPHGTNAYATSNAVWDGSKQTGFAPYVVFAGKRTPIHPAMTRYLAGHEYGHLVQQWIEHQKGYRDTTLLEKEYAAVRGVKFSGDYGGGRWHDNTGEVFANDFRILIAACELEYWPHPGVPRPEEVPGLRDWWQQLRDEYAV